MEHNHTNKPDIDACKHPTLIMELAFGGPTGNFICLECERLLPNTVVRNNHHDNTAKPRYQLPSVA